MKNLTLILLLLVVGCASRKERKKEFKSSINIHKSNIVIDSSKSFKPLQEFKGDTLAFIQESILNRKEHYIGKELNVLLTDLTIPIKLYSFTMSQNNIYVSNYLSLMLNNYFQQDLKIAKGEDPINLVIVWKNPVNFKDFEKISKNNNYKWTNEVQATL